MTRSELLPGAVTGGAVTGGAVTGGAAALRTWPLRRLLIALAPRGAEALELELCRPLAGGAAAEVSGLLIEDPRLLAHAGSRLAREIVLSGLERRLEPAALERQLRAQAGQVRRRFESAAARLGWRHDFRVVRGERLDVIERAAETADALVVDALRGAEAASPWSPADLRRLARTPLAALLLLREGWTAGREIVVVLSDEAEAAVAGASARSESAESPGSGSFARPATPLEAALAFARASGSPLVAAVFGAALPDAARLTAAVGSAAALAAVRFEGLIGLPGAPREALIAAIRGRNPRLLVLGRAGGEDEAFIDAVLDQLRAAVLRLGAGRSREHAVSAP